MRLFTTPGTASFTVPPTITHIVVELIGGGGAGGGSYSLNPAGSQGGGGAYTKAFLSVTAGATYTIVVGQGGTGVQVNDGRSGTITEFEDDENTVLAYANPGSGGSYTGENGGGVGGSSAGNDALFASAGVTGAVTGTTQTGVMLVPNGTLFGSGGAGAAASSFSAGTTGGNGAVLITY
jgi:hypothetical protein